MTTFKVRDRRGGKRYFIDNTLLRGGWGAKIGPYGIAVYNALALHADADDQSGYPSYKTIAELTGMSRRQAINKMAELEKWNIIEKSPRFTEAKNGAEHTSNEYVLLAPDEWKPISQDGNNGVVHTMHQGSESYAPGVVNQMHQGSESDAPKQDPIEQDPIEQHEEDEQAPNFGKAIALYHNNINISESPIVLEEMKKYAGLPLLWWREAIGIAAANNARRWSYVRGVLNRSKEKGVSPLKCPIEPKYQPQPKHNGHKKPEKIIVEEY